jgi:hypothetical protein
MAPISRLFTIVLADVKPLEIGIWAVFPTRTHMPARVRAFIDALRVWLLAAPDAASRAEQPRQEMRGRFLVTGNGLRFALRAPGLAPWVR